MSLTKDYVFKLELLVLSMTFLVLGVLGESAFYGVLAVGMLLCYWVAHFFISKKERAIDEAIEQLMEKDTKRRSDDD